MRFASAAAALTPQTVTSREMCVDMQPYPDMSITWQPKMSKNAGGAIFAYCAQFKPEMPPG